MYSSSRRKFNCTIPSLRTKSVVHFKVDGPNSLVVEKLELFGSLKETFNKSPGGTPRKFG